MWTTIWTWNWWFMLAAGTALAAAVTTLLSGLVFSAKERYFPAAITCTGIFLYALLEGFGLTKSLEWISYAYAILVLITSFLPWTVVRLLNLKRISPVIFLPLYGVVVAAFVFSPAFPDARDLTFGCYAGLTIKWAFWLSSGSAVIIALATGIWSLGFALKPGRSDNFKKGGTLAMGAILFAVFIMLQAFSDCKLSNARQVWGAAGAVVIVTAIGIIPLLDALGERHALELCRKNLDRQQVVSIRDPLTGLFNRGYFFETLNRSMERLRRDGEVFGLILADLDDFKQVNDRFGHPAGDYCLSAVGKVIMRHCRAYDCPARYGGDEFIILIAHHLDLKTLTEISKRMLNGINELVLPYGQARITINATMGVMLVQDSTLRTDKLLSLVDEAMYEGKQAGKGKLVVL